MKKNKKETCKQSATVSQHEDMALKMTAQFFQDEIMPALEIEGEVVGSYPPRVFIWK